MPGGLGEWVDHANNSCDRYRYGFAVRLVEVAAETSQQTVTTQFELRTPRRAVGRLSQNSGRKERLGGGWGATGTNILHPNSADQLTSCLINVRCNWIFRRCIRTSDRLTTTLIMPAWKECSITKTGVSVPVQSNYSRTNIELRIVLPIIGKNSISARKNFLDPTSCVNAAGSFQRKSIVSSVSSISCYTRKSLYGKLHE